MGLLSAVKNFFSPGSKEKEELVAAIQEWDELLKACTTRIEGLEKGYDFLRNNMLLKRELVIWKRLTLLSVGISLAAILGVVYLLFFKFR